MRKCYVIRGEVDQTKQSWIEGVYTSLHKANAEMFRLKLDNWHNLNNYYLTTEVLI